MMSYILKIGNIIVLTPFVIYSLLYSTYSISTNRLNIIKNNAEIVICISDKDYRLKVVTVWHKRSGRKIYRIDPLSASLIVGKDVLDSNEVRIKQVKSLGGAVRSIKGVEQDVRIRIHGMDEEIISEAKVCFYGDDTYYLLKNQGLIDKVGAYHVPYPSDNITITEFTGNATITYIDTIETKHGDSIHSNYLRGFNEWMRGLPLNLKELILPNAFTTMIITLFTLVYIMFSVLFMSVVFFVYEMYWKEKAKRKRNYLSSIVAVLILPSFCIAYIFSGIINKGNSYIVKIFVIVLILGLSDGILSGLYQQVVKMIKNEMYKDYITAIRAKGIRHDSRVIRAFNEILKGEPSIALHVLRNILPDLLVLVNNHVPYILNGAIVLEAIFRLEGTSKYILYGIRDIETIGKILTLVVFFMSMTKLMNYFFRIAIRKSSPSRN